MNSHGDFEVEDEPYGIVPAAISSLAWPLMLLLGLAVIELTSNGPLALVIVCTKFGWPDAATVLWVLRTDQHRGRAWSLFWFGLALAVWKCSSGRLFWQWD